MPTTRIVGTVVHGAKRGRELGFPTANVELSEEEEVEFGVYAGRLNGRPAAVSVGVRPTFGAGLKPLVEAYVLDFDGDLYGHTVTIELVERLRGEIAFDGVEPLLQQMQADIERVRAVIAKPAHRGAR